MTNPAIYFKEQLEEAEPCNGDYLQGATVDELVAIRLQQYDKKLDFLYEMDAPEAKQERENSVRASIENKIKEFEIHRGEKAVFFMNETSGESVQILRAWESELSSMHEKYDFVEMCGNAIPRLKPKT
jgi:hypothetical protein